MFQVHSCFKIVLIKKEYKYQLYLTKVTEKEIYNGILNAKNVDDDVLVFIREVVDIENEENIKSNSKLAARFIDLDKDGNVDKESKQLLHELKKRVIEKIPEKNIHHFKGVSYLSISKSVLFLF